MSRFIGLICTLIPFSLFGQGLLSEIMFDPPGADYTDEFVEIFNAGSIEIDLSCWQIGDGQGRDGLADAGWGLYLQPGQFGVILDGDYWEGGQVYRTLIPDSALIINLDGRTIGSGGLANSQGEWVFLYDDKGQAADSCLYQAGNESGYSEERVRLHPEDNVWQDSRVYWGTPGFMNSVSPRPYDAAVSISAGLLRDVKLGEAVTLSLKVHNSGIGKCRDASVSLYEVWNRQEERRVCFDFFVLPELSANDSMLISRVWRPLQSGLCRLAAELDFEKDLNTLNNRDSVFVQVAFERQNLVLNELMIEPAGVGGEWIEMANTTDKDINLKGWKLADSGEVYRLVTSENCWIPAGGYGLVVSSERELSEFSEAVRMTSWPALNNQSDRIFLMDPAGVLIDAAAYGGGPLAEPGFSLEKRNPLWKGTEADSWAPCVLFEGHSAGYQNSVFYEGSFRDTVLSLHPDPFSPDGDGFEDVAVIAYSLEEMDARISIKIFDIAGRLVRSLRNGQMSGMRGEVYWDGCNNEGRPLNTGIYIVLLQAAGQNSGHTECHKKTLVLVRDH